MSASTPTPREVATAILIVALSLLAASCASPPLSIYTLEPSNSPSEAAPLTSRALVIEIKRVVIPTLSIPRTSSFATGARCSAVATGGGPAVSLLGSPVT
jgi:hypothetical protein